ncbi:MAG: M20/M25/M40 family metallo-hydrolase [Candidatus Saccharimonas sp.]
MELLSALVAIPSESTHENDIADFIEQWLGERGITTYRQAGNIVAFVRGSLSTKTLVFNGHIDTVPSDDITKWTYGPYVPTIKDGVMYGLGVSDMKAGDAGLMALAEYYQTNTPPCDLWFSFVTQEETNGSGTQSFLTWFYEQKYNEAYERIEGLIPEPTNCEYFGLGHRGNYFIKLLLAPTTPELPQTLASLSRAIATLQTSWQTTYSHPLLGLPTIALTGVDYEVEISPNNGASLIIDVRTTPELHYKLQEALATFLHETYPTASFEVISDCPVGWCPDDSQLRAIATEHFPTIGQQSMPGSTDLCFFSERDIPCLIFGPGQREKMHSIDETFVCSKLDEYIALTKEIVGYYGRS